MKKYFVISHQSKDNSHINVQDLLPASCHLITGIAINATAKQEGQLQEVSQALSFPQQLITELLKEDTIVNLFYSYLRTRPTLEDSQAYFISDMLPVIVQELCDNIQYPCLSDDQQGALEHRINYTFHHGFADYLYNEVGLFEKGQELNNLEFAELIAHHILLFAYEHKDSVFVRTTEQYEQAQSYECGNISLLVNGNSFLLRDYMVTANRKVRHMSKEIIPFHEPLEVNSNLHTVFKSHKNSDNKALHLRIYIEYESLTQNEKPSLKPESNDEHQ